MNEAPPIHPIIYIAAGIWILSAILGIWAALCQNRTVQAQSLEVVSEIYKVRSSIQSEGQALRYLLTRQHKKRMKRLAREARLRLKLGPDADAVIDVQRILDAGQEGES